MTPRERLGSANRTVAGILAAVWLAAGVVAVAVGLMSGRWLLVVLGPLAFGYGVLWFRVAQTGRRLDAAWLRRGSR